MSHPNATPLSFNIANARGTLITMAESLHKLVAPSVDGSAAARLEECIELMLRMAQEMSPADSVKQALDALRGAPESFGPLELARLEATVLAQADADLQSTEARLTEDSGGVARNFDTQGLERYLQAHPRGGAGVRIDRLRQLPGGRSKLTVLAEQKGAIDLPADLVVRQDWAGGVIQISSVTSEYELLRGMFAAGMKVPEPLLTEPSKVLGAPFIVVRRVEGGTAGAFFDAPKSKSVILQSADQLAQLHRLPVEPFLRQGTPSGARTPEQMKAALAGFRTVQAQVGTPARTIDLALDWLEEQIPRIDLGIQSLVHNDFGPHNLMSQGDQLTSILDWELASIDHPAMDVGYSREWVTQQVPWEEFIGRYRDAGGPLFDSLTVDFYTIWSAIRLYTWSEQARVAVGIGVLRDMEVVHMSNKAVPRLLRRISRFLCLALERQVP